MWSKEEIKDLENLKAIIYHAFLRDDITAKQRTKYYALLLKIKENISR